ncbi:DUF1643 domain-containing protein [Sphingomonas sp. 3-13AW]
MRPDSVIALLQRYPDLVLREVQRLDRSVHGAVFGPIQPGKDIDSSLYRYVLWRIWQPGGRYLVAVMLNPSTATHLDDDPTIDRMTKRAHQLGYHGLIVVNVFAWRDTLPKDMRQAMDPVGPANDAAIDLVIDDATLIVCGWGANGDHLGRAAAVATQLENRGIQLHCLGMVSSGHPEHPLYLPYSRKPEPWSISSLRK